MGTRAMIFYNDGKKSRGFYVGRDGYLEFTGKVLKDNFNTYDKAKSLVESFSSTAQKHFHSVYMDLGIVEVKGEELSLIDTIEYEYSLVEYIYLFSKYDKEWLVYKTFSNKDFFSDFKASKRKTSSDYEVLFETIINQKGNLLIKLLNKEFNNKSLAQTVLNDTRDFVNSTMIDEDCPNICDYATKFLSVRESNASNFFAVEYKGQIRVDMNAGISAYLKFAKEFSENQFAISYDWYESLIGVNTFSSNMLNVYRNFVDLLIKDKVISKQVEKEFYEYLYEFFIPSIYVEIPSDANYIRMLDDEGISTLDFSVTLSLDIVDY